MRYEVGMVSFLLKKHQGGLVYFTVGEINPGAIEEIFNPVAVVEMAVEKGAASILTPVSCRSQLLDLSDDMATNADIRFHADAQDAV